MHRLYLGKTGTGLLWLCTGGLAYIGQIADVFYLHKMVEERNVELGLSADDVTAHKTATAVPIRVPRGVEDTFLIEIKQAAVALRQALADRGLTAQELPSADRLVASARRLHSERLELEELARGETRDKLETRLVQLRKRMETDEDSELAETYGEEAHSVAERLATLSMAERAASRMRSREHSLLNQLQAMLIEVRMMGAEEQLTASARGRIEKVQAEMKAQAEVDQELERAARPALATLTTS
jgi:hypothetical protein